MASFCQELVRNELCVYQTFMNIDSYIYVVKYLCLFTSSECCSILKITSSSYIYHRICHLVCSYSKPFHKNLIVQLFDRTSQTRLRHNTKPKFTHFKTIEARKRAYRIILAFPFCGCLNVLSLWILTFEICSCTFGAMSPVYSYFLVCGPVPHF
jgi:hypothetical protein